MTFAEIEAEFAGIKWKPLLDAARPLLEHADELQASFDLRWKADMRAIKRWQEANPGRENIWPDSADLCVWLIGEIERLAAPEADGEVEELANPHGEFMENLAKRFAQVEAANGSLQAQARAAIAIFMPLLRRQAREVERLTAMVAGHKLIREIDDDPFFWGMKSR